MSKFVEGVEFLTGTEASKMIGGSRQTFYSHIKPFLRAYHFGSRQAPYYNKAEVVAIATGKPMRRASIPIRGIFTDWTEFARSLGYNAQTVNREITVGALPDDIVKTFNLPADELFVKRGRMTFIDGTPVCSWDSYYPASLVSDILPQIQQGNASNIVEFIKEKHHLVIGRALDRVSVRITTHDELNLFQLLADEPVFLLQRAGWAKDGRTVVLYSDMVLLGSWFVIEREEEVHNWD